MTLKINQRMLKAEGSITVYLSLILLLILSLVFTIIEGARVGTGKVFAERALATAMDSVFAEYYRPLWDEYHIFGYHIDKENEAEKNRELEDKISQYLIFTLNPNKDQNTSLYGKGLDLYGLQSETTKVTSQTGLLNENGKLLMKEAVSYMKYQAVGNGLEQFLEKLSLLESSKKISVIYEKKLQAEEELVKIDQGVLRLMELLDGIKTGKAGLNLSKDGQLQISRCFIKKISSENITKKSVGINNDKVFYAVRDHYINPLMMMESSLHNTTLLKKLDQQMELLKRQQKLIIDAIQEAQERQRELSTNSSPSDASIYQREADSEVFLNLVRSLEELNTQMQDLQLSKNQIILSMSSSLQDLQLLVQELIPLIDEAISVTDQLQYKKSVAEGLLCEFEDTIQAEKESLGNELSKSLEKALVELEHYSSDDKEGYHFVEMKDALDGNRRILQEIYDNLDQAAAVLTDSQYQTFQDIMVRTENKFREYHTKELTLDYSTLVIDKSRQKNPIEEAGNIIKSGITGIVADPASLSDQKLNSNELPSIIDDLYNSEKDKINNMTEAFQNWEALLENENGSNLFRDFRDITRNITQLGDGMDYIAEVLLFQGYLNQHFLCYPIEGEDTSVRKPSALNYELEYLINGKMSDKENLSSCLTETVLIRMVLNFASIIADKDKCTEAKLAAASIIGFTGLPILVSMVQTLILLTWSFMEALLDVSALLMGKNIPVLKNKIILKFPELFQVNQSFLRNKAAALTQTKELSLSYREYLNIMILIKNKKTLAFRSMDLMQENINLRYQDKFHMKNCLYSFVAEVSFTIPSKFTSLSFIQQSMNHQTDHFDFTETSAYHY